MQKQKLFFAFQLTPKNSTSLSLSRKQLKMFKFIASLLVAQVLLAVTLPQAGDKELIGSAGKKFNPS